MADLFIEILSEDIPARMQVQATADFARLVEEGLSQAGFSYGAVTTHSTPRRIVLNIAGLPEHQADITEEKKGPKVGAPEKAVEGFLRSCGLSSIDACEQRETPKGAVWFAVKEIKGRPTQEILCEVIPAAMAALPWPKSMRWGGNQFRWVRPLRNIIALFDQKILPFGFDLMTGKGVTEGLEAACVEGDRVLTDQAPALLKACDTTFGHRFMAPEAIQVSTLDQYVTDLRAAKVMVDRAERKALIHKEAKQLVEAEGLVLPEDTKLLEEVTGLVEWPVPMIGSIDDVFMSVPKEALTSSMREHQKYFAVEHADGTLAPRFVLVANMDATDGGKAIVAGNERVLRARLADAKFFWDNDCGRKLEDNLPKLEKVTFHAKLGTLAARVDRMMALAEIVAPYAGADQADAKRAAQLSKADLVSEMVYEFTDLQGLMGKYYALNQSEKPEVAQAIADHYSPLGPSDTCPSAPVSIAASLAEKIDTLAGFFAIDEKPTGSKDPYSLRRAALGVIRLILENNLRLSLRVLLEQALALYQDQQKVTFDLAAVADDLMAFFGDRLKYVLKGQGVRHDLIDAVFALDGEDDFVRLLARVTALQAFLGSEDGENLLAAYRRAANIVRIEAKKDGQLPEGKPASDLLQEAEEKSLFEAMATVSGQALPKIKSEEFEGAMLDLATLRAPVDAFFEKVIVNAEQPELRSNRLRILSSIQQTLNDVADFSRIEG